MFDFEKHLEIHKSRSKPHSSPTPVQSDVDSISYHTDKRGWCSAIALQFTEDHVKERFLGPANLT